MRSCLWNLDASHFWIEDRKDVPPERITVKGKVYDFHIEVEALHPHRRYVEIKDE